MLKDSGLRYLIFYAHKSAKKPLQYSAFMVKKYKGHMLLNQLINTFRSEV
jgi:hypothetical protein